MLGIDRKAARFTWTAALILLLALLLSATVSGTLLRATAALM